MTGLRQICKKKNKKKTTYMVHVVCNHAEQLSDIIADISDDAEGTIREYVGINGKPRDDCREGEDQAC